MCLDEKKWQVIKKEKILSYYYMIVSWVAFRIANSEVLSIFVKVWNWPITLKTGYRIDMFENLVLQRLLGFKSEAVAGDWGKLRNEEFYEI
jgi:hypothetical protein